MSVSVIDSGNELEYINDRPTLINSRCAYCSLPNFVIERCNGTLRVGRNIVYIVGMDRILNRFEFDQI